MGNPLLVLKAIAARVGILAMSWMQTSSLSLWLLMSCYLSKKEERAPTTPHMIDMG